MIKIFVWEGKIPESKGCTLDTFKGRSSIRRKRFDKTSNAPSKLPEYDIGSVGESFQKHRSSS